MCNLYRQRNTENLSRLFDARPLQLPFEERPDIYPKYKAVVVRKEAGERRLECMAWGIVRTMPGKSGKPVNEALLAFAETEMELERVAVEQRFAHRHHQPYPGEPGQLTAYSLKEAQDGTSAS
jgi:putative SOS response-associated peptidase YedK